MGIVAEELYSLLIPLRSDRLVLPRVCVAEVVRYHMPADQEQQSGWFRGMIRWNNKAIPVVSFEMLCGQALSPISGRTRVVVVNPLGTADCPHYGLLAEGFPQMVKVNREVVVLDTTYQAPPGAPIMCRISMLKEQALIPDLEAIEQRIGAELAEKAGVS
jgi:chemosensory pili system protein ChpC